MKAMSKLIVANWKLHPLSVQEALRVVKASDHKHAVICPPFPFLSAVGKALKRAALGAQDVFWEEEGPHTGEVSAAMLKTFGATYVIIGHSERRGLLGEPDWMINKKMRAAQAAGLRTILCVGEPKAIRKHGIAAAKKYVAKQLKQDFAGVSGRVIVAYEPIWAIGTGVADKPKESAEMAWFIKSFCRSSLGLSRVQVLYGGSVKANNTRRFLEHAEIDGALVGGASLKGGEFRKILAHAG
jgi:triosephosphate isomerase